MNGDDRREKQQQQPEQQLKKPGFWAQLDAAAVTAVAATPARNRNHFRGEKEANSKSGIIGTGAMTMKKTTTEPREEEKEKMFRVSF